MLPVGTGSTELEVMRAGPCARLRVVPQQSCGRSGLVGGQNTIRVSGRYTAAQASVQFTVATRLGLCGSLGDCERRRRRYRLAGPPAATRRAVRPMDWLCGSCAQLASATWAPGAAVTAAEAVFVCGGVRGVVRVVRGSLGTGGG